MTSRSTPSIPVGPYLDHQLSTAEGAYLHGSIHGAVGGSRCPMHDGNDCRWQKIVARVEREARPTPVEPEARDRLFDEVDKRFGRNVARFVDARIARLAVEPDGLPLDVPQWKINAMRGLLSEIAERPCQWGGATISEQTCFPCRARYVLGLSKSDPTCVPQASMVRAPSEDEPWTGYFSPDDDVDGGHSER